MNLQDLQQDNEDFHTILESSIAQKNALSEKQRSSRSINPEVLSELYDIELEDHVLELKTDDYISYTIPVKQQEGAEYLQNIVVEEDAIRRSVILMRYELSNRTTNSSRSLSGLSSPTSPSQLTGNASKEYLSYEKKAEIENSFICSVVVYVPGRNCTAGDNHTVGESCVGEGDERATAGGFQTYYYSCPDDLGPEGTGGGSSGPSGISDNGGANSGGGVATSESLTLNEIAARYGGSVKVCLIKDSQGKCLEWFDYTPNPTLTMPLGGGTLGAIYEAKIKSMEEELNTPRGKAFQQYYRDSMSEQELNIFDGLNTNQQTQYLHSALTAVRAAESLFPRESQYNGKGDAFRHAYWNALLVDNIGEFLAKSLTTAHEQKPHEYSLQYKEKAMDLFNNEVGRELSKYNFYGEDLKQKVLKAFNKGELKYLNYLDSNSIPKYRATIKSKLILTNQ